LNTGVFSAALRHSNADLNPDRTCHFRRDLGHFTSKSDGWAVVGTYEPSTEVHLFLRRATKPANTRQSITLRRKNAPRITPKMACAIRIEIGVRMPLMQPEKPRWFQAGAPPSAHIARLAMRGCSAGIIGRQHRQHEDAWIIPINAPNHHVAKPNAWNMAT